MCPTRRSAESRYLVERKRHSVDSSRLRLSFPISSDTFGCACTTAPSIATTPAPRDARLQLDGSLGNTARTRTQGQQKIGFLPSSREARYALAAADVRDA
jgi:hypothetical protein